MASFKAALQQRVDAIEFDVRVTRDHIPVIVHDDFLPGKRGKKHRVAKSTYKDLKSLKPDLVTLDQALGFLQNKVQLIVEIKPEVDTEPIVECILPYLRRRLSPKNVMITSFDFKVLKQVKRALPEIPLGVNEKWSGLRATRHARALGTKTIIMNQRWLWAGFIRSMAKRYRILSYTINNPRQAARFGHAGLDSIITDYPDRF